MLIIIWDIPIAFVPFGWEKWCKCKLCMHDCCFFVVYIILWLDWKLSFYCVMDVYMYNTEYVPVTIRSVWYSTFCCKDVMIVAFNLVHYWLLTSNYGWHHFGILLMSSFRDFDLVVIHGQFYLPSPPKNVVCIVHSGGMSISMIIHSGKDTLKIVQSCSFFRWTTNNNKTLEVISINEVFFFGKSLFFQVPWTITNMLGPGRALGSWHWLPTLL